MTNQLQKTQPANDLALTKVEALDHVMGKIKGLQQSQSITLPKNYSPENAINSAWLKLLDTKDKENKPALEVCSKNSITETLYNMVLLGLSPAKNQCYFIVRGNKVCLDKSYFGSQAAIKRLPGVKDINGNVIYEKDVFEFGIDPATGYKKIFKHEQSLENFDNTKIKGAYVYIIREDGDNYLEIMNMEQIRASWGQGAMKGNSGAHKNFTDQMCLKTVINRACKKYINTSDDGDLFAQAWNSEDEDRYKDEEIVNTVDYSVNKEVKEKANKKTIDFNSASAAGPKPKEEPVIIEATVVEQTAMEGPSF